MAKYILPKKINCKNCYKCIRHCSVKSIRFSGNQANIMDDECILCGECYVICPQQAKEVRNDLGKAKNMILTEKMVIASIAPSFAANYLDVDIEEINKCLKKLGFYLAEETALGATLVKQQYDYLVDDIKQNIIISSCCPSVNLLIQKYYPEVLPFLARVISPMQAHCKSIKNKYPEAKTIFIGPCIAKKSEADAMEDIVDCVITFEELTEWLNQENIIFEPKKNIKKNDESRTRFFPVAGGIIKSMLCNSKNYNYITVDGINNCINAINDIVNGNLSSCFIEMSACVGSCIGGPAMDRKNLTPLQNYIAIEKYYGEKDFNNIEELSKENMIQEFPYLGIYRQKPGIKQIEEILKNMGKNNPEDELNCGSCGYKTCRDKAIAVYQGKANYSMCLPFLKEKAESFSDTIINNTPNGIFVLNESLEVQQINMAARKILNIRSQSDVLGEPVVRILDPSVFINVLQDKINIYRKSIYLGEYQKYVEMTVLYDKSNHILICIMCDVTDEQVENERKEKISRQTIETANKVVEKQMRVVQEIASLLGETTAETKTAMTRLKELFINE